MIQQRSPKFSELMNESRRNLLAFFISILVLLIATTSYSNLHPQFQRMGFVLTVLGILAWLLLRYPSGRRLSIPLVVLPLGALVLLGYVMSLRSPVPIIAIEKVSQSLPIVLALLLITDSLFGWWRVDTWENALVSFAILFCLLEYALAFLWLAGWWQVSGETMSFPPIGYRPQWLVSRSRQRVRRILEFSDSGRDSSIYHNRLPARSSAVVSGNRNFPSDSTARLIPRCVAGGNCGYCDNRCHPSHPASPRPAGFSTKSDATALSLLPAPHGSSQVRS